MQHLIRTNLTKECKFPHRKRCLWNRKSVCFKIPGFPSKYHLRFQHTVKYSQHSVTLSKLQTWFYWLCHGLFNVKFLSNCRDPLNPTHSLYPAVRRYLKVWWLISVLLALMSSALFLPVLWLASARFTQGERKVCRAEQRQLTLIIGNTNTLIHPNISTHSLFLWWVWHFVPLYTRCSTMTHVCFPLRMRGQCVHLCTYKSIKPTT